MKITEIKDSRLRLKLFLRMQERGENSIMFEGKECTLPRFVRFKMECMNCGHVLKPYFTARDALKTVKRIIPCPACGSSMNKTELLA